MQVTVPADTYQRVEADYDLTPTSPKPTVFIEGGYETANAIWTPRAIRLQAWHAMFAGAAGFTYGHWENAAPLQSHPPNTPCHYIHAPGAVQMAHLSYFMQAYYWWRFVPDQGVIASGEGSGTARHAAVKDSGGRECYVYYPQNTSAVINLNCVDGNGVLDNYYVEVKWFNPNTGEETAPQTIHYDSSHQTMAFNIPVSNPAWEDGVLMLRNIGN